MCGGPQEHITYDLVLASPAVSCMSGSSNLNSFRDRGRGGRIVGVLWGVAAWHHHHHHHVVPLARISLTFSQHFSLSFITSGRSSGLHSVSSHSYWMYVRAGRPAFARPYVGVHRSTSLMRSSLLLQQCPACPVRITWIVFLMGGRWPYSWCLVGYCHQDLFNIARSILV